MSPTRSTVALVAVAALSALVVPVEVAGALVAAVLAAAFADAFAVRRPPQVTRTVAGEIVRGVAVPLEIGIHDASARVRVRQPQTADLRVTPSEGRAGLAATVVAARRGAHELPAVVTATTGPLGLARWLHQHGQPAPIVAHADLPGGRRLATSVQQGRFSDPGLRRGALGLGTDFDRVRDYAPDDDIRRMNWKATERTGRPMVNQYREDTERDLWCLIDTGRLLSAPVGDRTRLDAALDAVAAVAAVADVVGDRVGAVVFDDQVRRVVTPRRAAAGPLVRSLDTLEARVVDTDYEAAFAQVATAKRALVVVFTDLMDLAASRPLLDAAPVLGRRHAVVVASVTDPDLVELITVPPVSIRAQRQGAIAHDLLRERHAVTVRLQSCSATVVEAPVDRFPSACVGAYLQLKARARL